MKQSEKDKIFMHMAKLASKYSRCNKKHLGCILVTRSGKVIYGSNGPPLPLEKCNPCPRLNSHSATDLHLCRAVHAERYVLLQCAKKGYKTDGAVLYSYMGVPCSNCLVELICAGVTEIVCLRDTYYDELSKSILKEWVEKGGKFRIFEA